MSEPTISLTPMQLVTVVVIEAQIAQLQLAANQLGGFLKLETEAGLMLAAIDVLERGKNKLKHEWQHGKPLIQPARVVPTLERVR